MNAPAKKVRPPVTPYLLKPFIPWLVEQKDRTDPVGKLARDTAAMMGFGVKVETYKQIKSHMAKHGASQQAMAALRMAHAEYRGYKYTPRLSHAGVV